MNEQNIFFAKAEHPQMKQAFLQAQQTFKYLWRELSWEYRRIIPALDVACVKVAFMEEGDQPGQPLVEHMWINDINFDGDTITGTLINEPNALQHIRNGDPVTIPLSQVSDWLFSCNRVTHGGFTIQVLRSGMTQEERKKHDAAWGMDFGDCNDILLVYEQKEHPENLTEHPMCINMKDSLKDFVQDNPDEVTGTDAAGYTFLHREVIAGNKSSVEVLLEAGADKQARTGTGKTALDFAKQLNWEHIIPLLEA